MRFLVGDAQEKAARLAERLAEVLAAEADGRGVDDREHLFEVPHQQGVEEHLVGVLEPAQEHVAFEVVRELAHGLQAARGLFLEGGDHRGQEAMQIEGVALLVRKGGALVEQGTVEKVVAAAVGLDVGAFKRPVSLFESHRAFSQSRAHTAASIQESITRSPPPQPSAQPSSQWGAGL